MRIPVPRRRTLSASGLALCAPKCCASQVTRPMAYLSPPPTSHRRMYPHGRHHPARRQAHGGSPQGCHHRHAPALDRRNPALLSRTTHGYLHFLVHNGRGRKTIPYLRRRGSAWHTGTTHITTIDREEAT